MRRAAWLIVPVIAIGLLALVVFATREPGPTTAFTLRPGDCFDIPGAAQIGDIAVLDCSTPHDAEVFAAGPVTDLLASASVSAGLPAYPGDTWFGTWVASNCGGVAEGRYLGGDPRTNLTVGYFYPDADAWLHGERQVTCYLHTIDGSQFTGPLAGGGSSAAPS
jgi:hypothetical protein